MVIVFEKENEENVEENFKDNRDGWFVFEKL